MSTEALGWFMIGVGSLGALQSIQALWRHCAKPREPNPEPGPRVTPHDLMIEGRREERRACEGQIELLLYQISVAVACDEKKGRPITVIGMLRSEQRRVCRELSELDQVLAEDERANN